MNVCQTSSPLASSFSKRSIVIVSSLVIFKCAMSPFLVFPLGSYRGHFHSEGWESLTAPLLSFRTLIGMVVPGLFLCPGMGLSMPLVLPGGLYQPI